MGCMWRVGRAPSAICTVVTTTWGPRLGRTNGWPMAVFVVVRTGITLTVATSSAIAEPRQARHSKRAAIGLFMVRFSFGVVGRIGLAATLAAAAWELGTILGDRLLHGEEHSLSPAQFFDQLLQHDHAMATADDMGMERICQYPPIVMVAHVGEIGEPILADEACIHQPRLDEVLQAHVFEDRKIVEGPADGHLDQCRIRSV